MFDFYCKYIEESKEFSLFYAKQQDIDNLMWPKGCEIANVTGDFFDHITIPEGVISFACANVGLKSITLPDSLQYVYLSQNKLSTLELPQNIKIVVADHNILTNISFRGNPTCIEELDLQTNRLLKFEFVPPESLVTINIAYNSYLKQENVSQEILNIIDTNDECYFRNLPPRHF